jgi:hypothetical protein
MYLFNFLVLPFFPVFLTLGFPFSGASGGRQEENSLSICPLYQMMSYFRTQTTFFSFSYLYANSSHLNILLSTKECFENNCWVMPVYIKISYCHSGLNAKVSHQKCHVLELFCLLNMCDKQ